MPPHWVLKYVFKRLNIKYRLEGEVESLNKRGGKLNIVIFIIKSVSSLYK